MLVCFIRPQALIAATVDHYHLCVRRIAKYKTFLNISDHYCPFVMTTHPKSGLCWQCQRNNVAVYRSANLDEATKLQHLQKQKEHLTHVAEERTLYREMMKDAQNAADGEGRPDIVHYSFDYAQQLHYTSDPMQPGPFYSLCPRKCGLFGIVCDGTNRQSD